ncbi:MAG TPA: FecR family protein [Burkholderiaceae bacterium]|nr:FecR family protein [Burkholderiaceae bacterium]
MGRSIFLAACLCVATALPLPVAAQAGGTLTILEGEALVYRNLGRLQAAEGARLAHGDIVETGANTFAQIELPDQSVLQLGPATSVMLDGSGAQRKTWVYFLEGWAKWTGPKKEPRPSAFELRAPLFELPPHTGVVVLRATPSEVTLFVERGPMRLAERQARGPATAVTLQSGEYYQRKGRTRGAVNPGAMQAFLSAMPRHFRDSLPSRLDKFADANVRLKETGAFAYKDVEAWLKAEPAVRRQFVRRWRSKSNESAFRTALIANLDAHPEWDPILFPEKYMPKETPAPTSQPTPSPAPRAAPPANLATPQPRPQ